MLFNILIFCISALIFIPLMLFASQYTATEMTIIYWGENAGQLKIDLPFHEDVYNTPQDSSDDWIEYNGPKQGFIDRNENIYIASYRYMQLKCFNNTGRLIRDFSEGEPGYNPEVFKTALRRIYVDSLCHIFVVDGSRYDYVAEIDTMGNLLNKISPYGVGSDIIVYDIKSNSHDVLTIGCKDHTYHTFENGIINSGGDVGWKAIDGNYYYGRLADSSRIIFYKYSNPDLQGIASDTRESYISLSNPVFINTEFLGVGDDMKLYICLVGPTPAERKVQIYDTSYNLVNEIDFPNSENKYSWYMTPYMRPKDGNIYEFRCLDDGLHVIRWSKQ